MNPPSTPRRILLVEDDADIASVVRLHLSDLPSTVEVEHDGARGFGRARQEAWSLILLDVRLPGMNGLDICRQLRADGLRTPIMMLTSRVTELDRVLGLELGADDYLTKPFGVSELQARVKALWRRAEGLNPPAAPGTDPESLRCEGLCIDRAQRRCWVEGEELQLTPREFDLLWHFARQPARVFSRADLLEQVWGYGYDGYEHTVNSHINRLRSKLRSRYIHTVWGVGYRFQH